MNRNHRRATQSRFVWGRPAIVPVFFLLLLFGSLTGSCEARGMPVRRVPLNDEIGLLDTATAKQVKGTSQALYRELKSELAVLIIRSTEGENAGAFAERVFNTWTLGQAGVNNGMLILFAIDDRRVEIKPGIRYRDHFTADYCNNLLTQWVVPEMRAGRPAAGVLAASREVAAEIRHVEATMKRPVGATGAVTPPKVTKTANPGAGTATQPSATPAAPTPTTTTVTSDSSAGSTPPPTGPGFNPLRLIVYFLIAVMVIGGGIFYQQLYGEGRALIPVWFFGFLVISAGVVVGLFVKGIPDFFDSTLDAVFSGAGGIAGLIYLWAAFHVCPRCNRYLVVYKDTLRYPTYHSTGLGQETSHCEHCGYHDVRTYTISRKTKSHSHSSSRSRSGGGGRSSGGGGGASW